MTQKEIDVLKKLVTQYIQKDAYTDMKISELASLIIEENDDIYLTHRSIRSYVSMIRKDMELQKTLLGHTPKESLNIEETLPEPKEPFVATTTPPSKLDWEEADSMMLAQSTAVEVVFDKYSVIDEKFFLEHRGESLEFDIAFIDKVFCAYTKKGLSLSGPVVQSIFGLNADQFRAIVYRMGLTKESKPYTNYTQDILEVDALAKYLEENVAEVLELLYETDGTVTTKLTKSYKEALVKMQNQTLVLTSLFNGIKHLLPKVEVIPLKVIGNSLEGIIHLFIPDMHIGLDQPNYNNEIVALKLVEVLDFINIGQNNPIHVHFMGDIIHSVSGLNHLNSWKNMIPSNTGASAIINPFELLLNFLSSIEGLERVNIVGGE